MSDSPDAPSEPQASPKRPQTQAERRAAQLQAALRENLRRRKVAGARVLTSPESDHHEKAKQNDGEK